MRNVLKLGVVGAAAAAAAYVARLIGPKVRAGDTVLASVAAAGFGGQLVPVVGAAPFLLLHVSQVTHDGVYGSIVGAGTSTVGTDLVRVTKTAPFPAPPQQMGPVAFTAIVNNRWQAA